jgi:hypothetical protein
MKAFWLGMAILGLSFFLQPNPVMARKKLVRSAEVVPVDSFWNKLKLRADSQALLLILGGMQHASSVTYQLTYQTNGISQGIEGIHDPVLGNTQKELVFGTCSAADCIAALNITDMIFELRVGLENGQTLLKRYQINP